MKRKAAQKRLIEIMSYIQVDWGLTPVCASHLLALWPLASYLTYLCIRFLGVELDVLHRGVVRTEIRHIQGLHSGRQAVRAQF